MGVWSRSHATRPQVYVGDRWVSGPEVVVGGWSESPTTLHTTVPVTELAQETMRRPTPHQACGEIYPRSCINQASVPVGASFTSHDRNLWMSLGEVA